MNDVRTLPGPAVLDATTLSAFRARLSGDVLTPDQPGYNDARRLWNGMTDRYPALIARCTGPADVVAAVNLAREAGLEVAVRGGGLHVSGYEACDGSLVIDLSPMREVHVDPPARTVRAGGGCTWADVDAATRPFGLAVPCGLSRLQQRDGMTLGNPLAVDVVTAEGRFLRASATENADLFRAVRGGGGHFGIVTAFEYRLREFGPEVMIVEVMYPLDQAHDVLRAYRAFITTAPDEVTADLFLWSVPAVDELPAELHGTGFVAVEALFTGMAEEGTRVLQPLRELGSPLLDLSGPRPSPGLHGMFEGFFPAGKPRYSRKSLFFDVLSDDLLDVLAARAADRPSPHMLLSVRHLGGDIGRVPAEVTAFGDRIPRFILSIGATRDASGEDAASAAWTQAFWQDVQPLSNGRMYFDFPPLLEECSELTGQRHEPGYNHLGSVKTRYGPVNLFRLDQNLPPAL